MQFFALRRFLVFLTLIKIQCSNLGGRYNYLKEFGWTKTLKASKEHVLEMLIGYQNITKQKDSSCGIIVVNTTGCLSFIDSFRSVGSAT